MKQSLVIKRILREYRECVFDNIKVSIDEENVFIWKVLMIPNDGFYKDIPLNFEIYLPSNYPLSFQYPKIFTPYFIKNNNYRIVNILNEDTGEETIKYEFVLCNIDLWCWDITNIRSLLINLYWYFNNEYIDYSYLKMKHIFYNKGLYDSVEVTQNANIIINHLIDDIIEYNKNNKNFSKYLKI